MCVERQMLSCRFPVPQLQTMPPCTPYPPPLPTTTGFPPLFLVYFFNFVYNSSSPTNFLITLRCRGSRLYGLIGGNRRQHRLSPSPQADGVRAEVLRSVPRVHLHRPRGAARGQVLAHQAPAGGRLIPRHGPHPEQGPASRLWVASGAGGGPVSTETLQRCSPVLFVVRIRAKQTRGKLTFPDQNRSRCAFMHACNVTFSIWMCPLAHRGGSTGGSHSLPTW